MRKLQSSEVNCPKDLQGIRGKTRILMLICLIPDYVSVFVLFLLYSIISLKYFNFNVLSILNMLQS